MARLMLLWCSVLLGGFSCVYWLFRALWGVLIRVWRVCFDLCFLDAQAGF